ncbi:MAG: DUF4388 domain-containing protein [Acidobacteriota bacterium]|nr:DUF4388 domain-containing protein [Acidobacteriota bacterium]
MTISGNLLDVSIADVMQFVHLGGRTGTLEVECDDRRAEVGFHRGRIVNAWSPGSKRLGEILRERGIIDSETLSKALERQETDVPRVSLGKLLVSMGVVDTATLREIVAEKIEMTVYELVSWSHGRFEFALDELRPVDDVGVYPGDVLPDINLNTQMVVLEALRIFDERNRAAKLGKEDESQAPVDEEEAPAAREAGAVNKGAALSESEEALREVTREVELTLPRQFVSEQQQEVAQQQEASAVRLQIVSRDRELFERLRALVGEAGEQVETVRVELWDAGLTLPGESPPVVLVDLRDESLGIEDVARLRRARAHATIIAVGDQSASSASAYEAGVLAFLPADPGAITACFENVLRNRRGRAAALSETQGAKTGFAKLRRVVADLRSGLLSATVALNLMQVISESVERAIMFLVRRDKLVALGAFGFDKENRSLAHLTHGVEVELNGPSALVEAVNDGQARSLVFEDANLPEQLVQLIGRPRTGQVVIFPVLGSGAVNSVVYTDNGSLSREIGEIEILELAAAQVGVAFENEMLRRQMDRLEDDGIKPS